MPLSKAEKQELAELEELDALEAQFGAPTETATPENNNDFGVIGNPVLEAAAGVNRGVGGLVDFWTSDPINSAIANIASPVSEALGGEQIDYRVPSLTGYLQDKGMAIGGYMKPGIAKDMVGQAGEIIPSAVGVGGALRYAANRLPAIAPALEGTATNIFRQLRYGSSAGDAAFGGLGAAGMEGGGELGAVVAGEEYGRPVGEVVGAFGLPVAAAATAKPLTDLFKLGSSGIANFFKGAPKNMNEDQLAGILSEAMIRENLTPDQAIARLKQLGKEGLPADIGDNFARLLRLASNKIPRVQGEAGSVLNKRQIGSGSRIMAALDDTTGTGATTLDSEIQRIDDVMKPRITELYKETGAEGIQLSPKLKAWFTGSNSIGKAQKKVEARLADRRSMGEEITNIDYIDQTKRVLDDQIAKAIRAGQRDKVSILTRLKNEMVAEADSSIPVYKQARQLSAGKFSLENAADAGTLFFKLKPREMQSLTKTYSPSEKRLFKLGVKQAILDKVDNTTVTHDMVNKMFGKGGEVKKLRMLFDTDAEFKTFADALQREARFTMTRRQLQGNSTTAQQLMDDKSSYEKFTEISRAISNPIDAGSFISRTMAKLRANKGTDEYMKALEDVGYLLSQKGVDPKRIKSLLEKGSRKQIESRMNQAFKKELSAPYAGGVIAAEANQQEAGRTGTVQ